MTEHLYGKPGAEEMHRSAEDAYETEIGHDRADRADTYVIEEWSVRAPRSQAPGADTVLFWVTDHVSDYGEVDGQAIIQWDAAAKKPDVVAAFDAALDLMASKVTYRMADKHLRDLTVTFDLDGTPLLDGAPMYHGEPT